MILHLESRYLIQGVLELDTPLHLGGSEALEATSDQPVVRDHDGNPYIPGSSLKGAFRSTVEKLAATLGMKPDIDVIDQSSTFAKAFSRRRNEENWSDEETIKHVQNEWPATAHLFGTPYTAGKIFFTDARLVEHQAYVIQRRDGVGIDRDSERAVDNLLYNYEVVPSSLLFHFELRIENPTEVELGLACLGLSELRSGFFALGGKRSAGLGRCHLHPETRAFKLDLQLEQPEERLKRLQRYLVETLPENKFDPIGDVDTFVEDSIKRLIATIQERRQNDAPATGE